jgi:hypothetical protein
MFPQNTSLGKLELVEIYEYYDRPVLFTCRNGTGTYFLAQADDIDDEAETWLYVGMSRLRFEHLRSGEIDLHDAFTDAEDEIVFEVRIPHNETESQEIKPLIAEQIQDDRLPMRGEFLKLPTPTLPSLDVDLPRKALQARREYMALILDFHTELRTEAPARPLGKILEAIQATVDELGRRVSRLYSTGKSITPDLRRQVELSVTNLGSGSFNVELAARQSGLFDETLLSDSLEELVGILNIGAEESLLKQRLEYKSLATQYYRLLQALREASVDTTEVRWASPVPGRSGVARITALTIYQAIEILNSWTEREVRQFNVTGGLEGLLLIGKRFEITGNDGELYTGTIPSNIDIDAFERMRNATLNKRYRAVIRETTITRMSAEKPTIKYELIELHSLGD